MLMDHRVLSGHKKISAGEDFLLDLNEKMQHPKFPSRVATKLKVTNEIADPWPQSRVRDPAIMEKILVR